MTKAERRNYRIAIIVSLIFHAILFFAYFPIHPKPVTLDTYPVGMVELAQGSGGLNNHPAVITGIPVDKKRNTNKTALDPHKPQLNKPAQPSSEIPVKNLKSKPESEVKPQIIKPSGNTGVTGPQTGENQQTPRVPGSNGTGNSPDNQPTGFGSGEGMVSQLGPLPPYPKNAMNEGKEGEVTVRILVLASGSLDKVMLLQSSGDSRLDKVTVNSITQGWRFKPVTKDYYIDLIFVFNLQSGVTVKFVKSETGK